MRKAIGMLGLVCALIALACVYEFTRNGEVRFLTHANLRNLLTWVGLFGILSLAQALVIITGGIDLSVGSMVGLIGVTAAIWLNRGEGMHPVVVIPGVLFLAGLIGMGHGLLITKVRMQPFVVTLCGLFFYRGIARFIAGDATQGFGIGFQQLRWLGRGFVPYETSLIPAPFCVFLIMAAIAGAFLHFTAPGRHIFALGANEDAARYSGIPTDRLKIICYVLCSVVTAWGGLLLAFKVNSLGPSDFGNFYELYAIAGAVLGGCSLRGGTGNVFGIVVGASLIVVLRNLVNILQIPSQLEYVVIGGAILVGVCADELFMRRKLSQTTS